MKRFERFQGRNDEDVKQSTYTVRYAREAAMVEHRMCYCDKDRGGSGYQRMHESGYRSKVMRTHLQVYNDCHKAGHEINYLPVVRGEVGSDVRSSRSQCTINE